MLLIRITGGAWGRLANKICERFLRPTGSGPSFVTDYSKNDTKRVLPLTCELAGQVKS